MQELEISEDVIKEAMSIFEKLRPSISKWSFNYFKKNKFCFYSIQFNNNFK